MKRFYKVFLFFFIVPVLFSFDVPSEHHFQIAKNMEIFSSVFREVDKYYVEGVEPSVLMQSGIDAMLKSLDPYTTFIPEEDIEDFRMITTGEYGGIGAMIGTRSDRVLVLQPYKGFPADKAGLHIGDEIESINDVSTQGKNSQEISKLLRGQANTALDLLVRRIGVDTLIRFSFERGKVKVKSVPYVGMLNDSIGYFKLTSFTETAASEVVEAIKNLKSQGANSLVFDLRDNTGGLLFQAIEICNFFIPKDRLVVSTKGKVDDWNSIYKTKRDPVDLEIPLTILTNGMSASASEIVAGVMQDYDRAIVIGANTFGKGLVQSTFKTAYNSKVKITTAKYYIPSGRCIQEVEYGREKSETDTIRTEFKTVSGRTVYDGKGIAPDVKIQSDSLDDYLIKLIQKDVLFDYAVYSYYQESEKSYKTGRDVQFTNTDYKNFVNWFYEKEIDIILSADKQIASLENFLVSDTIQFTTIRKLLADKKKQLLSKNSNYIKKRIREYLAAHYLYKAGRIGASLAQDEEVLEAKRILSDKALYEKILGLE